ncbi:MAG: DUF4397 domain-containing protein [Terracidiphilus sp.]
MLSALGLALALSACENVAGYTQPSLVRVIDASYMAPAVNVDVERALIASNIGQGSITSYATLPASINAAVAVTAVTGGATLASANGALLAGQQQSIFLTDNSAAPAGYQVTILEDQQAPAPAGHSAFRFLNQAVKTGAVDIYMVPSGATLAESIPLVSDLGVGVSAGYVNFAAQTVTMVITPTGLATPSYTSAALALTGGEVRTVLIIDTQLTSNPPIQIYMANDVN